MSDTVKLDQVGEPRGFQFPGRFEITAVGEAAANMPERVSRLLADAGLEVVPETLRERPSRQGKYISVTVAFECPNRARYELAHTVLRNDDAIHYTI